MPNARRQDQQIILLHPHPNPLVAQRAHIEKALPVQNIANLLVLVQVLVEEHAHFVFVGVAHRGRGDGDLVAVLVRPFGRDDVHAADFGAAVVQDAEGGEDVGGDGPAGVVVETLVAL